MKNQLLIPGIETRRLVEQKTMTQCCKYQVVDVIQKQIRAVHTNMFLLLDLGTVGLSNSMLLTTIGEQRHIMEKQPI